MCDNLPRRQDGVVAENAGVFLKTHRIFAIRAPVKTLTEAQGRAQRLRADLEKRGVHPDVLRSCRAELLQENYFQVVLEAAKTIAQKLRDRTGLASDGAELADAALALGKHGMPFLAFNTLRTDSEISERTACSTSSRASSEPSGSDSPRSKNLMEHDQPDALDLLTMAASFIHRRLDSAARTPRQM